MNRLNKSLVMALLLGLSCADSLALVSRTGGQVDYQFRKADAVLRGVVTAREPVSNGHGRHETRYTVEVEETLKGKLPARLWVVLPGGMSGTLPMSEGCQPVLRVGERRLFFLKRGPRGKLHLLAEAASALRVPDDSPELAKVRFLAVTATDAGGDLTDQASSTPALPVVAAASQSTGTNLLVDSTYGLPLRFVTPDRGEPIPYLVDADLLPSGVTLSQALAAVSNALAAWKAVAPLEFEFRGVQSFGNSAKNVGGGDGILRIQLHDGWGVITSTDTLGIGGSSYYTNILDAGWTTGGRVYNNDFHRSVQGYVVLNDLGDGMGNLLTFEEVLCHEIGHALGMAHSTPDTPAPIYSPAWEAQMYYIAHEDGRGAAPTPWDTNVLQQIHPSANTPPYTFDRVMDVVTASPQPSVVGINEIQVKGYDRQGTTPSVAFTQATGNNGSFSQPSGLLRYTAFSASNGARLDPAGTSFYDYIYARCSDGIHASPFVWLRVVSLSVDQYPPTSDGIPDNWMIANFGNANPAVGTNHGASNDKDGDRIINRDEYRSWMNPTTAASAQLISAAADGTVSWQGKAYELYELHASTNLSNWFFVEAVLPTNDTPTLKVRPSSYGSVSYRAFKVP